MRAGVVILPSEVEGLPFVALEAAAVGARVAWSDIPAHREVFGEYGGRFAVGDVAALTSALSSPRNWPALTVDAQRAAELYERAAARRADALDELLRLAASPQRTDAPPHIHN
jgi:glycosyltransferase involved in cell wall biosynthesis